MTTKNPSQEIEELLKKINDAIADGEYIFRGEATTHSKNENGKLEENKVSSNLYRDFEKAAKAENFNMKTVQDEILENVKEHTKETNEDAILEQLQHWGGKTNQIDFSTDYLIALFFACDGAHNEDGRLIFLDKEESKAQIHNPRQPENRVITQKSVFVRPPTGTVKPDKKITIDKDLKKSILSYLEKHHGISTKTIYNDIHGYIIRHKSHESAYTNFYLGLIHQNEQEYELAIEYYTEALRYNSAYFKAYNNRGNVYDNKGEYDKAITDYNKAIEINPNYAMAYNNRGNSYDNKGKYDKAITDYNKAIELNSNYAMAYNNRGNAYDNKGEYDKAIADYNKAIELNSNYAMAYNNRGVAYGNKIEYDKAIADFNKSIELNPNNAEACSNRGLAKKALQDHKGAKKDLQIALKLAEQQKNKSLTKRIQNLIADLPADPES